MGSVKFVDETTTGGRGDGWGMDIAEERLALRELIRRRIFREAAESDSGTAGAVAWCARPGERARWTRRRRPRRRSPPSGATASRLSTRVTFKGTLKVVDTALAARAEALGLSREEVEELAVPTYGLDAAGLDAAGPTGVGRAEFTFGEAAALLEVRGSKAVLSWRDAAGKAVKTVPAAVRQDHAEELKELKAAVKDIDKMLSARAERLDRQFLARRTWAYGAWRERYLDHPLVGTLARRLVWTVAGVPAVYDGTDLRTIEGDPLCVTAEAEVLLWHPIGREPAEVAAVRERLEALGVTQPFRQAHREVYPLTEAERRTGTYSDRFAGHVLRQHQFHSLAAVRGWRNKLRLCVDDSAPPAVRELPQWGLCAEYWIGGEDSGDAQPDTTESGSYLRLTTDQVRFYPIDAPQNWAHCGGGAYSTCSSGSPAWATTPPGPTAAPRAGTARTGPRTASASSGRAPRPGGRCWSGWCRGWRSRTAAGPDGPDTARAPPPERIRGRGPRTRHTCEVIRSGG
ncbi:DUF4132 domain-containing protein [Streptomyces sp. ISL-43]|uniref:DUF4132 domain-containing protein n=1 Tax=Streptomyces sp. ISL-43 TaxID=2819183 RepID=UPI0027E3BB9C|nr:DUF4132 domain-containing protein [Streptomyces sp. ISL-43]